MSNRYKDAYQMLFKAAETIDLSANDDREEHYRVMLIKMCEKISHSIYLKNKYMVAGENLPSGLMSDGNGGLIPVQFKQL